MIASVITVQPYRPTSVNRKEESGRTERGVSDVGRGTHPFVIRQGCAQDYPGTRSLRVLPDIVSFLSWLRVLVLRGPKRALAWHTLRRTRHRKNRLRESEWEIWNERQKGL